jgi:hypothetical protein
MISPPVNNQNTQDRVYVLGHSAEELDRLIDQARLFGELTEEVFVRAGIGAGMRVLDVGCQREGTPDRNSRPAFTGRSTLQRRSDRPATLSWRVDANPPDKRRLSALTRLMEGKERINLCHSRYN